MTARRLNRDRSPDGYPFRLRCNICKDPDAGRGKTPQGAKSGLGYHKRHWHGIVGGHSQSSGMTNDTLDAIGEYLEACGVVIAR